MSPLQNDPISSIQHNFYASPQNLWHKVYDILPSTNSIKPVWDGSHLYYACFCHESGEDYWIVLEHTTFAHHSPSPIKVGEIIHPTHWMEIFPPLT
jgi:hypothetical protein